MTQALWNGQILADSEECIEVEGNAYFPPAAVKIAFLSPCDTTSVCSWKGTARYYDISVDGQTNPAAAWYYPEPKPAAEQIRDYVAFWNGVEIRD